MNSAYSPRAGVSAAVVLAIFAAVAHAQVSDNASLNGRYFFRQVALLTSGGAAISQTESASGLLIFDGFGGFTINGVQLTGAAPSAALSGSGTYTVNSGGFVTLSNPLLPGVTVNARLGANALVGSSTEAGPNTFDLFLAIPGATNGVTNRTLSGSYWVSSLEFPNGGVADIRETNFTLTANQQGAFLENSVTGQANNLGNTLMTQTVGPMSYLLQTDGSGTMTFPAAAGLDMTTQLIEGVKTVYVSPDGTFFIGGSTEAGGHGIIVGVRAYSAVTGGVTNSNWTGFYYAAGMHYDISPAKLAAVTASVDPTSLGAVWERRTRESDGLFDATPLIPYSLTGDGSGTYNSMYNSTKGHIDLALTGTTFSTTGVNVASSSHYELYFGTSAVPQSAFGQGPGPFINPQGVDNAASYAPPGYPVSPGGFVALFGSGLAPQLDFTAPPYPLSMDNVQVTVNGIPAPLYAISPNQINLVVPYEVTGSTATFVVINGGNLSDAVTVPLSPTAPGVFSLNSDGLGDGAILHPDSSVVYQGSPAKPGEIVRVFLTGLGAVTPGVPDGRVAPSAPSAIVTAPVTVTVGGVPVTNIQFQGLSPGLASLYQLSIQIPLSVGAGPQPLAVQTPNGYTQLVDVWVHP